SEHHRGAGPRPAGLQERDVPGGGSDLGRQGELADTSRLAPLPQPQPERTSPTDHDQDYCSGPGFDRFPDEESTSPAPSHQRCGMPPLSSSITVDAPADHVWDIVAHRFDRIGEWATVIPSSAAAPESMPLASTSSATTPVDVPVAGRVCHTGMHAVPEVT